MDIHILSGPNFSGRTLRLRNWAGLSNDDLEESAWTGCAYVGPDVASCLSGIAPTVEAELELMAADPAALEQAQSAIERLGFGYCLSQNPFTRSVHKVIAGLMRPRDDNSSGVPRGVSGRQSSHLTHYRSRSQAGS